MNFDLIGIRYLGTQGFPKNVPQLGHTFDDAEESILAPLPIGLNLVEQGSFRAVPHLLAEVPDGELLGNGETAIAVFVFARDVAGNTIADQALVTVEAVGAKLGKLKPVDGHTGVFQATLTAPKMAGKAVVTATVAGEPCAPLGFEFATVPAPPDAASPAEPK